MVLKLSENISVNTRPIVNSVWMSFVRTVIGVALSCFIQRGS